MPAMADIVARLSLNGSQFSAELAKQFGSVEAAARDTAARTQSAFEGSFNQIQQLAQRALSMPRNAGGSLDLGVGAAKEAASAAHAQALALREVALAAESAANKVGDTSENTRLYIQAARAAANEAEHAARGAREQAMALDTLQIELNQTRSATDVVIQGNRLLNQSHDTVVRSSGNSRMAMVQASQQVQDFFIQVGGGQRILTAFTQQASQMAFVMQGATGVVGRMAGILSSGWGSAIFAGLSLLSLFSMRTKESSESVEDLTAKLGAQAAKTKMAEDAQAAWAKTAVGAAAELGKLTAEIDAQNRSLDENVRLKRQQISDTLKQTVGSIQKSTKDLADAIKALKAAQRELDAAESGAGAGDATQANQNVLAARVERDRALARVNQLRAQLREYTQKAEGGARTLRQVDLQLIDRNVEESMTAEGRAAATLRRELERLRAERAAGHITAKQYEEDQRAARAANQKELDRVRKERQEEKKEGKTISLLDPVDGPITSGYGLRKRPMAGASKFHPAIDFGVPVGTSVKAGADGIVIKTGMVPGLGNVVLIDYGNKVTAEFGHLSEILVKEGDAVSRGEVVAKSGNTGISTGPHLDYRLKVGGAYVDPRGRRVNVGAGAGDALADYEKGSDRDAERDAKAEAKRAEELQKYVTLQRQSFDLMGLHLQNLDAEADLQKQTNDIERDYAERVAALPEGQRKVSDELDAQIKKVDEQATAMEGLLKSHGDRSTLTAEEKAAEDGVLGALRAQLVAAEALAKTDADRLRLAKARAVVEARLDVAMQTGDSTGKDQDRKAAEAQKKWEEWNKDQQERQKQQINDLADFYERAFSTGGKSIWDDFKSQGKRALAMLAAQWTLALLSGQKASFGSILGQIGATTQGGGGGGFSIGGLFGSLFGGQKSSAGPAAGGSGDFLSSIFTATGAPFGSGGAPATGIGEAGALGGQAGGILGSAAAMEPHIAAALAIVSVGNMISEKIFKRKPFAGGLFGLAGDLLFGKKIKKDDGSTSILGNLGSITTNSRGDYRSETGDAASTIETTLRDIAEQLGAGLGSFAVSIGNRDGSWRVDPEGLGRTKDSSSWGGASFGEDQAAAIRFAILDAIKDGALTGLTQASQNLLKSAKDLEASLKKVELIESIPKRLRQMIDPVGFAIDEFNKQWSKAIAALREGGASAEQMAEAQKLYNMELEDVKASTKEASADLKAFLDSLKFGGSSPYSLRDQEAAAREKLQPFLDKIEAGDRIDQGAFTATASQFLEIERSLYGSTGKFFEAMDLIQNATGKAISTIDNAVPIRTISDPFNETTATNTGDTATNTGTTNDILDQVSGQLGSIISLLGGSSVVAAGPVQNDFIGDAGTAPAREFTQAGRNVA